MAHVSSYSHQSRFSVPAANVDRAWFSLQSWKGYLCSVPGLLTVRMAGRVLGNGDVRFCVSTVWEYEEQIDEWVRGNLTADRLLASFRPPLYDVTAELYEDLD